MHRRLFLLCVCVIGGFTPTARAGLIITFQEFGNDVTATGSGTANTDALAFLLGLSSSQVNLEPGSGNYRGGDVGVPFNLFSGISGPSSFGPGNSNNNIPSASSGDYFGLTAFNNRLFLPQGYSGGTLSHTATWNNSSFASLGLTPGQYIYTWGIGPTFDTLTIHVSNAAVPEPSSMVLLSLGAALVGGGFRRRRRAQKNLRPNAVS